MDNSKLFRIKKMLLLAMVAVFCLFGYKTYAGKPVAGSKASSQSLPGCAVQTGILNGPDWSFRENKGQLMDENHKPLNDIPFCGRQGGVNIYCKAGEISFVFAKAENDDKVSEATGKLSESGLQDKKTINKDGFRKPDGQSTISLARADLVLLGSNPTAAITATDQQAYYENYYTTGDADHGITNVHTYKTITYTNIYPNIDMVLEAKPNSMEYSFIVHPGGNVDDIQLQWNGLDNIKELENGGIEYQLPVASVGVGFTPARVERAGASPAHAFTETTPISYQQLTIDNQQSTIPSTLTRHGSRLSFSVGKYDKTKTLVIDPTLSWGTYYGSANAFGQGITTDVHNDVYVTGYTASTTGIATSGAYQTTLAGGDDVFVAKFSFAGSLYWGTYYGGSGFDEGNGITADDSNYIYITGTTESTNGIATSGAHETSFSGYDDAFVAKFNLGGSLLWGTYYGGAGQEIGNGITHDDSNKIYITGFTESTKGIATSGAYKTIFSGYFDAFVAKFNSWGSLSWGTYYGGSGDDEGYGITADQNNNDIYITGYTQSTTSIATSGGYQTTYSGYDDAFVVKFTSRGSLSWGTYYGGIGNDRGYGITTDNNNNVYITGYSGSGIGIATFGAYQTSLSGNFDAFIAKFTSLGSLSWGTYYGGAGNEEGYGITADPTNNLYITGITQSFSGIATTGAYQTRLGGDYDVYIAKFTSLGGLSWGTYYGGGNPDYGQGIAANANDNVYVTGFTGSNDTNIATIGAYQTSFGGGTFAPFVAKFSDCIAPFANAGHPQTIDSGNSATIGAAAVSGNSYSWQSSPSGFSDTIANPTVYPTITTTYFLTESTPAQCSHANSVVITVNIPLHIFISVSGTTHYAGDDINITATVPSPFKKDNIFTIQMSGPNGSFATPTVLATKTNTATKTYTLLLPVNALSGAHYRFRVIASDPIDTSADNGTDITITNAAKVMASECGLSYQLGDTIRCNAFTSTAYGFRLVNSANTSDVHTYKSSGKFAPLSDFSPALSYGVSYKASIKLYSGATAGSYGDSSCTISTFLPSILSVSVTGTNHYAGDDINITSTISSLFKPRNIFTIQMSGPNGSFATSTVLATRTTTAATKTYTLLLPVNALSGAHYRFRVIASDPIDTSADNGTDITITNAAKVMASECGLSYQLGDTIRCNAFTSTAYGFRLVNNANTSDVHTYKSSGKFAPLSDFSPALSYGIAYKASIKLYSGATAGSYGDSSCTISTNSLSNLVSTKLAAGQCGNKINGNTLNAVVIPGISEYVFKVYDNASCTSQIGNTVTQVSHSLKTGAIGTTLTVGNKYYITIQTSIDNHISTLASGDTCSFVVGSSGFSSPDPMFNNNLSATESISLLVSPNPFSTSLSISYTLPENQNVQLTITDITGKQIAVLSNENQAKGVHSFSLDAGKYNMQGGIYFLRLMAGNELEMQKIVRLK